MSRTALSGLLLAGLSFGCGGDTPEPPTVAQEELASPAGDDSGEPFLTVFDGDAYLSWLEASDEGGHDLRMARLEDDGWGTANTIAHSDRFFVNWADFPSITATEDGTLWAHWLERGGVGTYDYGIRLVRSSDRGATWSAPFRPHADTGPNEHGFVSALPLDGRTGFSWLDGNKYAPSADGTPATEEMSLHYRWLGHDGTPGPETVVDGRVCDCCQTATALTDDGPVIVYRNRTEDEIRDIYLARQLDGEWVPGAPVHDDGWETAACPVNGPDVEARGMAVAVAWFTAPENVARVKVAFSHDGGATFGEPTVVDDGNPGGRVSLLMGGDRSVLVTWLERTGGEGAELRLRRVYPDGMSSASVALTSSSSARASGFPKTAALDDGSFLLAWTDVGGESPRVRVSRVRID